MQKNNKGTIILPVIISLFIGALGTTLVFLNFSSNGNGSIIQNVNKVTITENSIADAVNKIYDAVVVVEASKEGKQISTGTGFVYKTKDNVAYILTNNHVIDNSDDINIIYSDGSNTNAQIVGKETYSDIAVLQVAKSTILSVAELGNSKDVKIGDTLFTVGTPLGKKYQGTVTKGILSGKDRLVEVSLSGNVTDYIMRVLQTDAAINPGNSGGPLVNINGEVIGINSLKLVEDEIEGMGFAIPIEDALNFAEILEQGKKVKRPFLGVEIIELSEKNYLKYYNINVSSNVESGVVIANVSDNSPAKEAGLNKGDVITQINDSKVKSIAEFRYELFKYQPGEKITIKYYRGNKELSSKITLGNSND